MSKRVCAALLALLISVLACTPALADGPPAPPADSGFAEQQEPTEAAPAPEPPPVQGSTTPTPEQTEETQPPGGPAQDGLETEPPNTLSPELSPDAPPPEEGCNTIEELSELVARSEGGTVAVAADLILPEGGLVSLSADTPVTIDLGPHGITVPQGAFLALDGPITLTGDGAPRPLLTVYGELDTQGGPALSAEGDGAVAVYLAGGQWYPGQASVRASGANARAVEVEATELDLYHVALTAQGENSLCVRSDSPVRLILCRAEGEGALADAPALTLDGTAASPEPEYARIIRREAGPGDPLSANGLCLPVGETEEELAELLEWRLGAEVRYNLYDSAAEEYPLTESVAGTWTGGPVDLSRPGAYRFTGTPTESLGGVALPERTVWLYVVDPGRPWLEEADKGRGGVSLRYFRPIQGAESTTLWYSVDGGEHWEDAAGLPGADVYADGAFLGALPLENHDYRFRLEVRGGTMEGKSNALFFPYYDDRHWNGGDWDGGDRDDQGDLPPANEIIPPPEQDGTPPGPPPTPDRDDGDTPSIRPDQGDGHTPTPTPTPEPAPEPSPSIPPTIIYIQEEEPEEAPRPQPPLSGSPAEAPSSQSPVTTPPPQPQEMPQASAPAASRPQSAVPAEATLTLTAAELQDRLRASPAGVTLLGGDLKVFLPAGLLAGAADGLAARLDRPEAGAFEVRFWTGGKEVAGFEGGTFTVAVPIEAEGEPFCTAPDGAEIAGSSLAEDRAEFTLTATGVYTLGARSPEQEAPAQTEAPAQSAAPAPVEPEASPPILPLALCAAGLLAAFGGILLYGRRRRK